MKVVITDVSVLFDLFHLQVLNEFFSLELEIYTTDFIYNEILITEQKQEFASFELQKKLHIFKINPEEEEEIRRMKVIRANRSFPDKTLLWKARQLNCAFLTCDNALRKEAIHLGLEVHGSLWVIEQLRKENLKTNNECIGLFDHLKTINTRLPLDEIDKLIRKLK
jgi:predicted nucleic acid-binding protein